MQRETERSGDALISIVVPVYNTQAYLSRCVESLLSQTYRNFELLLIDDGSTDESPRILDSFAKADARVRVVRQENAGVSAARNCGISLARGSFIGFVDSDDWVEPTYLERLLHPFAQYPDLGVSICGWYIHRGGTVLPGTQKGFGRLNSREANRIALDLSHGYHGYLWNKLFRTALFAEHAGIRLDPDVSICEDLLLCTRIFLTGAAAFDSGEPLYHYLYRESGALRTLDDRRLSEYTARERIAELLKADETLYHAAELAHAKAALNLLADAKETNNRALAQLMQTRIDKRLPMLLRARDLPRGERVKLAVRRAFPKWSMRVFRRIRKSGGSYGEDL